MPKIIDNLREKLLEEAHRQIMTEGYQNVTIRSIAAGCGVGMGTVYNYFSSKDELIAGFLIQDWMECLSRIRAAETPDATSREILGKTCEELAAFDYRYRDLFHSPSVKLPSPPRQYHAILRDQIAKLLRPYCEEDFASEFLSEAIITWTVEGKTFEELYPFLRKLVL